VDRIAVSRPLSRDFYLCDPSCVVNAQGHVFADRGQDDRCGLAAVHYMTLVHIHGVGTFGVG